MKRYSLNINTGEINIIEETKEEIPSSPDLISLEKEKIKDLIKTKLSNIGFGEKEIKFLLGGGV